MTFLNIGIGFLMLSAGRPAYATFVGGVSYIVGAYLAQRFNLFPAEWNAIAMPLLFWIFGALAAFSFRRWAVRVAGFLAGGYLLFNFPAIFNAQTSLASWPVFILIGGVCLALLLVWFDYTVVILSTLVGITLMLTSMDLGTFDPLTMLILLTLFGAITQYVLLQYIKPSPD